MTDLTTSYGVPPTQFTLSQGACQVMTIQNALSSYSRPEMFVTLGGHTIHAVHGDGDEPDTFYVIPAPGFFADRDAVTLAEDEAGEIEICQEGMS